MAGAQSACPAGILGTRPRRCPRRQTRARKGAGAGRQANDIMRPRERQDDSVNELAQRETPHVGIFWLTQTPDGDARLLTAGCPLDQAEPYGDCLTYDPGHYEPGRTGAATGPSIPPCAPWCGPPNTRTGRADVSSSTGLKALSALLAPAPNRTWPGPGQHRLAGLRTLCPIAKHRSSPRCARHPEKGTCQ
jgi:hypothetical protein